jgi:hypothetical protein
VAGLVRDALEHRCTFAEGVHTLRTSRLISPCYFIVAGCGVDEGVGITRDPNPATEQRLQLLADGPIIQVNTGECGASRS